MTMSNEKVLTHNEKLQENMTFYINIFETSSSYWTKIAFNDLIQVKEKYKNDDII